MGKSAITSMGIQSDLPCIYSTIVVRTAGDPSALAPTIHKLRSQIDPIQPPYNIERLEQSLSDSIAPRRFNLFLLGGFALATLLLPIAGACGAMSHSAHSCAWRWSRSGAACCTKECWSRWPVSPQTDRGLVAGVPDRETALRSEGHDPWTSARRPSLWREPLSRPARPALKSCLDRCGAFTLREE
jgi:hypothetical protein